MENNKTKIVIGTSQLGWNLNFKKKKELLDVIKYSLERKIPLHISTLYGNSIDIISKNFFPISNSLNLSTYLRFIIFFLGGPKI